MEIDYTRDPETGNWALVDGLAAIGRKKDVRWLVRQLKSLDEAELLERFQPWPGKVEPEGIWGTIAIGPYIVMCQLLVPPRHKRALGAELMLKVDRAGTPASILARLRELG